MGFGKLFTKEGKNETRRSSTLSKISQWSHKQSNKRNSQPSPAVSFSSLQHSKSISHNPFETTPVTPSQSMRNVHAATERTSSSSMDHTLFDHVVSPTPYATFDEKVELHDDDNNNATPVQDENLHNELLAVSLQLDTVNPKNAIEIKHRLNNVNTLLINALDTSSQLQSKLTTVIATSKQTILSVTEENNELKKDHSVALAGLTEQHVENQALKKQQHDVLVENSTLKEQYKTILDQKLLLVEDKTELQEKLDTVTGDQSELKEQINALIKDKGEMQDEVDRQIAEMVQSKGEMTTRLMEKEGELNALKGDLKEMETKYQQLIMKSENDERQYQSEMRSSGALANHQQEQHNAVLAQEKLKLADCTSQIRDLIRTRDKSNEDINKIVQENRQLKVLLDTLKEENIGLKEQIEQLSRIDSKAATHSMNHTMTTVTMEERKDLEKENRRLQKLVDRPAQMDGDDIMRTHTKAQLVLIEYLEGQDDVIQAMAKFKKQLEE